VTAVSPVGYDGLPVIAGPITSGGWPIEAGFASLQMLQELSMQHGAFFTDQDEASGAAVAAIGPEVASHFFPGVANPVGRQFRIGAVNFQVVGVVGMQGGVPGDDFTDLTYIPFNTYKQRLSGHNPPQLLVQVDQGANIQSVMTAIDNALAQQHRLAAGQPPDFDVSYYNASADPEVQQLHLARLVMIIVAAVLLLVGGFGIASTAFLAVQQRRREIGLRMAVGAHPGDVQRQFLTEAMLLSIIGGATGVVAGIVGSHFKIVGVQPVLAWSSVALAFGVGVGVGLFFGIYPANRAASLRPIDALRYE
jgi:putative ABC transport system permease protein